MVGVAVVVVVVTAAVVVVAALVVVVVPPATTLMVTLPRIDVGVPPVPNICNTKGLFASVTSVEFCTEIIFPLAGLMVKAPVRSPAVMLYAVGRFPPVTTKVHTAVGAGVRAGTSGQV